MRTTDHDITGAIRVFTLLFVCGVFALLWGCVPDNPPSPPDGCPLPAYKVGDIVLVDDVYISTVLGREIVGCGDIFYRVRTNVEVDGELLELADVKEDRITPYEPSIE